MEKFFKERYKLIHEIKQEDSERLYLVKDKNSDNEYIIKEILQEATERDNEILIKEFSELINNGATLDVSGISPVIKDFFIENNTRYLVVENQNEADTIDWLLAFPSIGCIFKNSYIVISGVATGGFGIVYQVKDANLPGRYWALKEMYDDSEKPDVIERSFRREAEILSSLEHPCIPIIVNFFTDEYRHYLVMEYIKGHTLEEMIDNLEDDEFFPESIILDWGIQICDVLEYLHTREKPVVFRDMKPDNIIIMKQGEFKLIDFGISCIFEGPRGKTTLHTLLSEGYAPQEQWLGKAEPRSDIYSLGATLHHLTTKTHPREFAPDFPSPDQLNSAISRDLSSVILKALEPKMANRYQSISEMKRDLLTIVKKKKTSEEEECLLKYGEKYETEEDYFKALSGYMKVLEINPSSEKANYKLALCYEKLGFKDKALEHYYKTLEVSFNPDIKEACDERIKFFEGKVVESDLGVEPARMMEEIQIITAKSLKNGSYLSDKDFNLTIRLGHCSPVTSVCFIPGKKYIASSSKEQGIKIWNIEKGILHYNLEGHLDSVNSISVTPDGEFLLSGSSDKTVKLWELKTRTLSYVFSGFENEVGPVSISPDGKKFAAASGEQVHLWDLHLKKLLCIFEGHKEKIKSLEFSSDGRFIFSVGTDLTTRIWELENRKIIYSFDFEPEKTRAISIRPEGEIIALSSEKSVRIMDIGTKRIITTLEGTEFRIESLAFSPRGHMIAGGDNEGNLYIWDIEKSSLLKVLTGHKGRITSISWNSESTKFISGSSDFTVKLWSSEEWNLLHTFSGNCTSIESISLSANGKTLAAGASDNTIRLWDIRSRTQVGVLQEHNQPVNSLSYNPEAPLLASGSWDEKVFIWDMEQRIVIHNIDVNSGLIGAIIFSPDGKTFATGGSDNTIKLWETETGKLLKTFEGSDWSVEALSFSPDGKWLASSGSSNTITMWHINSGEKLESLTEHNDSVLTIAFGPNKKYLISGSKDNTVKLWLVEGKFLSKNIKSKLVHTFEGHTASVLSVCFNNGGELVASAGKDNIINIWDTSSFELLFTLKSHSSSITSLSFSRDDRFLFSGSRDGTIKMWDMEEKSLFCTLMSLNKEGSFEYISYSPDNNYNCSEGAKEHIVFEKK